jgi:hypothetical protein
LTAVERGGHDANYRYAARRLVLRNQNGHFQKPKLSEVLGQAEGSHRSGANWHAAAYHCLDVAASANALLEANDPLRRQLAELLPIPERQLIDLITFWMALHDVGKFSAPFNVQIDDLWLPEMGERSSSKTAPALARPRPLSYWRIV